MKCTNCQQVIPLESVVDVNVVKLKQPKGNLKYVGDVIICDAVRVSFRIYEGDNGRRTIYYPSRKDKSGKWVNTAGPINHDTAGKLNELILAAVDNVENGDDIDFP